MKKIDIASIQKLRYETYEKEKDILIVIKINGGYTVSNLNKASTYTVNKDTDGSVTCTCKDYSNYKGAVRCKHIIAVGKKACKNSNSVIKTEGRKINQIEEENNMNNQIINNIGTKIQEDAVDLQAILTRPFPMEQIKYRKGFNGKQLAYVETHNVINRLNEAFKFQWSWEVTGYEVQEKQVFCKGRISVCINGSMVVKEGFGGKTRAGELGDDLKGAASDALKKAASLLGIGLHLYISQQIPQKPSSTGTSTVPSTAIQGQRPDASYNNTSSTPAKASTVAPATAQVGSSSKYPGGNGKSGSNGGNGNGGGGNGKTDINQIIKKW